MQPTKSRHPIKSRPLVVAYVIDGRDRQSLAELRCDCEFAVTQAELVSTEFQRSPSLFVIEGSNDDGGKSLETVSNLRHQRPLTEVLVWAPRAAGSSVRSYFLAGAKDVVVSPNAASLAQVVKETLDEQQLLPRMNDLGRRRSKQSRFESMLSRSQSMWDLFDLCSRIAPTEATVLIIGETGTGKELLARAIHRRSNRKGRFVAANCASIPPELVNSELFGHEKGAFTGADRGRDGLVAHANQGTLFLDEIGDMPAEGQLSLLRMLQEMRIRPVGSLVETKVDLRVIAATNVPLDQAVREGDFREDLFYRLDVIRMNVPPLRDRPEDVLFLFGNFIKRLSKDYGVDQPLYADSFLDALLQYDWPGNVRQLENFSERLVLARPQRSLTARDFTKLRSSSLAAPAQKSDAALREGEAAALSKLEVDPGKTLKQNLGTVTKRLERQYLEAILNKTSGRVSQAASLAGISRRTLLRKMNAHRIDKRAFRSPEA